MLALSPTQCSAWLEARQTVEQPVAPDTPPKQYARLKAVASFEVARCLVGLLGQPLDVLLQFTDWSVFGERPQPEALSFLDRVVPATGEWPQHATRGLAFLSEDQATLVECCEYLLSEGASAYLYAPRVSLTIGLWESEFIELWSPEPLLLRSGIQALAATQVPLIASRGA
jgi:hypothetical protein